MTSSLLMIDPSEFMMDVDVGLDETRTGIPEADDVTMPPLLIMSIEMSDG